MAEQSLMIPVDEQVKVEARLIRGTLPKSAVICHPHPLYGGNMDNNVVLAAQAIFQRLGWNVVRFNFRGVGHSSGQHANGMGERADLEAVCRFLRSQPGEPDGPPDKAGILCLVGYSFGAWVAMGAVNDGLTTDSLILVSPPLDFMRFDGLPLPPIPCLITLGECDDFCRVASLRHWLECAPQTGIQRQVSTFSGVDHFYSGREGLLQEEIKGFLQNSG